jgi:hypothetical protein
MAHSSVNRRSKLVLTLAIVTYLVISCKPEQNNEDQDKSRIPEKITLSTSVLRDKIMGGWAGQVIGCTFGGPTEFDYQGTMIQDYQPLEWNDQMITWYYDHAPGLYDDIYMDLTFVDVFDKEGLDAPAVSHAQAFAHAEYALWHANQAARYNILNGIDPPASGHWENNPHADDIDFQIEADFAGLMSPGMVNSASEICDRVGHIMNYGDGWYGGVYVAAMYALAFSSDDVGFVVWEGLKSIPEESQFHQCISDVIGWCGEFPGDWKRTWFETQRKWSSDIGCPDGVFDPFNIDAKLNAAYIVIGLMYGEGDFGKTLDISTRCGQDSDCNPASAGGILGTMIGYSEIPEVWKSGLEPVLDRDFKYTTISLNDVYDMSYRHALEMIGKNGGTVGEGEVTIVTEQPEAVRFEKAFEGHYPVKLMQVNREQGSLKKGGPTGYDFSFSGKGFVVRGGAWKEQGNLDDQELILEVYVDGTLLEKAVLPTSFQSRRHEVTWAYNLEDGDHEVHLEWNNPAGGARIDLGPVLVYGPEPDRK